jgi:hypothetical protein
MLCKNQKQHQPRLLSSKDVFSGIDLGLSYWYGRTLLSHRTKGSQFYKGKFVQPGLSTLMIVHCQLPIPGQVRKGTMIPYAITDNQARRVIEPLNLCAEWIMCKHLCQVCLNFSFPVGPPFAHLVHDHLFWARTSGCT